MAEQIPDQQGRLRIVIGADPGPGIEFAITQDAAVRWKIKSLQAQLVTSVGVASRIPELIFIVGGVEVLRLPASIKQTASKTVNWNWIPGIGYTSPSGSISILNALPQDLLFNNQVIIGSATVDIDVGDQWSGIRLIVEEWIEPLV